VVPEKFVPAYCEAAAKAMGTANTNVLVLTNKGMHDDVFTESERLPPAPHGLNEFGKYRNMVVTGAYNQHPAHAKFLREVTGLSDLEIWRGTHLMMVYQGIERSALRNPDNREPVGIALIDRQTPHPPPSWLLLVTNSFCKS
jgi:hypothetical protein